jgi:hypothetical protein
MLVGIFLTAIVGGPGCESGGRAYRPLRIAPMIAPFESDIPVPMGFRFVEHASEDRATGTMRLYLRHSYQGDAHKLNVRNFYRDEMPLAQWVKVSDGNVKGEYTLRFEKGNESCTVLIRDAQGRGGGTLVQVIISQEQRGATPPTTRSKR